MIVIFRAFVLGLGAALIGCSRPAEAPVAVAPVPAVRDTIPTSRPAAPAEPATAAFPTTAPQPGPAPSLQLPVPVERTLANGLRVIYVPQRELPIAQAVLVVRGAGATDDPGSRPGLASFTADLLDEGAGGRSALEMAAALDRLGANLSAGAGWDAAQVNLGVLSRRLPAALALMADVVARPDFPEKEVVRVREQRLVELARGRDEPRVIAGNAFASLVYGAEHPFGRFATVASTRGLDRASLVRFHRSAYNPASSALILVGDVEPDALHPVVERAFGGWRGQGAAQGAAQATAQVGQVGAAPQSATTAIYLVDKPGAAQSEVRIGHPGVARNTPDFFALQVLNTLLGGSFTSRLNQNLREQHGYAYGAGSSFQMRRAAGPFTASSAVVTAKTDSAVYEFFRELRRIREEPVPAAELERAKQYLALGLPADFETTSDVAGRLAELVTYGLPLTFYNGFVSRISAVTAEEVRRVANEYIRPDRSVVVVVGDRKTVEAGLRGLNLGPVRVRQVAEFVR